MSLISNVEKVSKQKVRLRIPSNIKEETEAYCRWARIDNLNHFFAEAAKLVFYKDKQWQQFNATKDLDDMQS